MSLHDFRSWAWDRVTFSVAREMILDACRAVDVCNAWVYCAKHAPGNCSTDKNLMGVRKKLIFAHVPGTLRLAFLAVHLIASAGFDNFLEIWESCRTPAKWDFKSLDIDAGNVLKDAFEAVTRAECWEFMHHFNPKEGFVFAAHNNLTKIRRHMRHKHSACSFRWVLHQAQFVARHGFWNLLVDLHLEAACHDRPEPSSKRHAQVERVCHLIAKKSAWANVAEALSSGEERHAIGPIKDIEWAIIRNSVLYIAEYGFS